MQFPNPLYWLGWVGGEGVEEWKHFFKWKLGTIVVCYKKEQNGSNVT